ncbi:glycoside hydrolase family 108 protein [Aquibium sp. ELW1220]|uniref:glycoside hydrolase family 108 protein n=1 Tax=Aquibium sp. ELW1220 TaxID=2976766 RepID=UPI0025AEFF6A|nr:glycoside hydrolase family 108 protein [Aquibium sp. ELW1220]MDN2582991.1 glycoside hydrolase family 108 protein [Aquibium sp. ELW1220]
MDSNFQRALSRVLKHEGGYVDHPKDPGGATNKGVTIATFRRYVKPNGTKADLRAITGEQVATVYYKHYWAAVHANELPAGVDYAVFDLAVNSGPSRAARFLQRVVGATEDGRIGPATLAAVRKADPTELIARLCDARLVWLKTLKTWPTFGKGWERRVTEVRHDAILDAADDTFEKVVVEDAVITDRAPASSPQTPRTSQLGILAVAIIGAILMALSQLWNWITGG